MPTRAQASPAVPRLTYLRIKNYRALRDVEFRDLTPLTVLIGPNGSGKSTVLDALDFLAEAVRGNLVGAWEKRERLRGIRTAGEMGPISFEIELGPFSSGEILNYSLELEEVDNVISRSSERLTLKQKADDSYSLFSFEKAHKSEEQQNLILLAEGIDGVNGGAPGNEKRLVNGKEYLIVPSYMPLDSISLPSLAFSAGAVRPFATQIVDAITKYRYVHLTDDHLRGYSDAGPREKLSPNGDNLPNVLYYLHTKHPETLAKITAQMRRWVPGLADIVTEITSDERLLLRFRDSPFEKPLPAQYMSDGTMRLAALLTLLYEPDAAGLLGIEEPENELHPRLLHQLAEELIKATEHRQLLIATHSPALLNAFEPEQVWVLHRGADGYTQATRTADIPNVKELVEDGSPLGYLWTSNSFTVGDPLAPRSAADAR